jgi:hypothetical protein
MFLRLGNKDFNFNTLDKHVINIHLHIYANLLTKHHIDQPLVCCPHTLQPKRHHVVEVQPSTDEEGCFLLLQLMHADLVLAR